MMILLFAFACGHSLVSWEFQPPPAVSASLSEVVVVVSADECQDIANEIAMTLAMRDGHSIHPDARTRLILNMCSVESETRTVAARPSAKGKTAPDDRISRGKGSALVTVELDGRPMGMVKAESLRMQRSSTAQSASETMGADIEKAVVSELATDLVQQLAPLPETVERRWYRKPKPGTAKSLHNQAVDAERAGNFEEAVRLAKLAAEAKNDRHTADYLRAVESRLSKR